MAVVMLPGAWWSFSGLSLSRLEALPLQAVFSEMPRRQGSIDAEEGHWVGIYLSLQKHWLHQPTPLTPYSLNQQASF